MKHNIFRGWDDEKKIMLPAVDLSTPGRTWPDWFGRIDCELLQFTGQRDIAGSYLFDQDILLVFGAHEKPSRVALLIWDDESAFFDIWFIKSISNCHFPKLRNCDWVDRVKRIGSARQNPELLEMK